MKKQLLVCAIPVAFLVLGVAMQVLAADVKSTDIVNGPNGPVFAEQNFTISSGQTVEWNPKTAPGVPHHLVQIMPDGSKPDITSTFAAPDKSSPHTFTAAGAAKIQCTFHPRTMNQTITVK